MSHTRQCIKMTGHQNIFLYTHVTKKKRQTSSSFSDTQFDFIGHVIFMLQINLVELYLVYQVDG